MTYKTTFQAYIYSYRENLKKNCLLKPYLLPLELINGEKHFIFINKPFDFDLKNTFSPFLSLGGRGRSQKIEFAYFQLRFNQMYSLHFLSNFSLTKLDVLAAKKSKKIFFES